MIKIGIKNEEGILAEDQTQKPKAQRSVRFWEKISRFLIYLLVFLLPLWFLPLTINVLDFNKQALLIVLTFLSLFSWFLKSLSEGKIGFMFDLFNLVLLVFLLFVGLSTFFSDWPYGSFWGWPLPISPSFVTLFGFFLLYFLIINIFGKRDIFNLFLILIISSFFVAIFGILQIFGKFILPFDFSKTPSFNTIGTINSLAIFSAIVLPLLVSLILVSRSWVKIGFSLIGLAFLSLLFLVNFWPAWLVLLVGISLILVFGIARREIFQANWLILPMTLLLLSFFFGVIRITIPGLPSPSLEFLPSYKMSWQITLQTLKEEKNSFFFGSGPGTFFYNYSQFKPPEINQTNFWGMRFFSGTSEILDRLMTTGIFGFFSFLGILIFFGWLGFRKLAKKEEDASIWALNLGILASWLSLVAANFLYPFNLSLSFLFWFLIAAFLIQLERKRKSWSLESSFRVSLFVSFFFVLILISGTFFLFLFSQRYLAEVNYFQSLQAFQKGDNSAAINYLNRAIQKTAGKQDNYWQDLAQLYLFQVQNELQNPNFSQDEKNQRVAPLLVNLVNSVKAGSDIAPKNVANWASRGFVYRQLIGIAEGAVDWAIKSYEEAIRLEPTNPYLYTELGLVYLANQKLAEAKEQFQKAVDLKSDYAPAHFQLALIYVSEGKTAEGIRKMEEIKQIAPLDVGLAFQLGILYYNEKKLELAKREFERAVALNQNYSNARYFLGLIYNEEGDKKRAIEQFEKISQLNPENEEVKKILANLKEGKPILEGIVPPPPPIEEKPFERLQKQK